MKIQPHETVFTELPDPKGYLERCLRDHQCVDKGSTIECIKEFGNKVPFKFNIIDVKPQNQFNCICLVDANLNLDFDVPLDYQEISPTKLKREANKNIKPEEDVEEDKTGAFYGKGMRLDGKTVKQVAKEDAQILWNPRENRLPNGVRPKFAGGKIVDFDKM